MNDFVRNFEELSEAEIFEIEGGRVVVKTPKPPTVDHNGRVPSK